MTTFNSGAQPQNRAPQSIGFLLLDNFTLISLASAVEPLRMANQLSGRELYRWTTSPSMAARSGPVTACRSPPTPPCTKPRQWTP